MEPFTFPYGGGGGGGGGGLSDKCTYMYAPPPLCCTKVYMALLCYRGKYRHPPLGCTKVYMLLLCFEKIWTPLIEYSKQSNNLKPYTYIHLQRFKDSFVIPLH